MSSATKTLAQTLPMMQLHSRFCYCPVHSTLPVYKTGFLLNMVTPSGVVFTGGVGLQDSRTVRLTAEHCCIEDTRACERRVAARSCKEDFTLSSSETKCQHCCGRYFRTGTKRTCPLSQRTRRRHMCLLLYSLVLSNDKYMNLECWWCERVKCGSAPR